MHRMTRQLHFVLLSLILISSFAVAAEIVKTDIDITKLSSCAIRVNPGELMRFEKLTASFGDLQIIAENGHVFPIECQGGVMGVVVVARGTVTMLRDPNEPFQERFHSAVLRFNPDEFKQKVKLDGGERVSDAGIVELGEDLLNNVIHHCWWKQGKTLLVTPKGVGSAVVYSVHYGDTLLTDYGKGKPKLIYSFTQNKKIYVHP